MDLQPFELDRRAPPLFLQVLDAAIGALAWWLIGYGLAFGFSNGAFNLSPAVTQKGTTNSKSQREFIGHSLFAAHQLERQELQTYYSGISGFAHW